MRFLKIIIINLVMLSIVFLIGELFLRYQMDFKKDSVSAVGIKIFQESDINGWEHKPYSVDYNGYGDPPPKIYINNLGFRDDDFKYNENENSILMLGDSFTFGTGLSKKEIFPELLEEKLNQQYLKKWNVLNAGHIGYAVDNYYLLLKKHIEEVKPKMVIMNFFVANDVTELRRHNWVKKKDDIIKVIDQKVFVKNNQLMSYENKIPNSYFLFFLNQRYQILLAKLGYKERVHPTLTWPVFLKETDEGYDDRIPYFWNKVFESLDMIDRFTRERNIIFKIVIIPMDVQVSEHYWDKYPNKYFTEESFQARRPQEKLTTFCQKKKIECLDLLPFFQKNKNIDKLYYQNEDPHFDKIGHQVTAELIYNFISSNFNIYE